MTVPNTFHFVWTGQTFPYYARLAVESVLLAEPEASVVIHTFGPSPRAARHWDRVLLYDRVRTLHEEVDTLFADLPAPASEYIQLLGAIGAKAYSAQSNLVRLAVLYRDGGIYLDFDIFVLRSLAPLRANEAFVGEELAMAADHGIQAARADLRRLRSPATVLRTARTFGAAIVPGLAHTVSTQTRHLAASLGRHRDPLPAVLRQFDRVWARPELNNAVLGAAPKSRFIAQTLQLALKQDPAVRYSLGPTLLNRSWDHNSSHVTRLSPEAFYPVAPSRSFEFFECVPFVPSSETYLLHYVSSNHSDLLAQLDETRVTDLREHATFYATAFQVQDSARGLALRDVPFMQR
jgi:hypothetical protein